MAGGSVPTRGFCHVVRESGPAARAKSPGWGPARVFSKWMIVLRPRCESAADIARVLAFLAIARRARDLLDVAFPRDLSTGSRKPHFRKFGSISPLGATHFGGSGLAARLGSTTAFRHRKTSPHGHPTAATVATLSSVSCSNGGQSPVRS